MRQRFRYGISLFLILITVLHIIPVFAMVAAGPELSVKLEMIPPVTLCALGPINLFYQPEKNLAEKPRLAPTTWRLVEGGAMNLYQSWQVTLMDGWIRLTSDRGDLITSDLPLLVRSPAGGFELNGKLLWPTDGLLFFNEVGLEDYVTGVLGSEAYAGWPLEALKANAVAIRTYTLSSLGKHGVFALCAKDHCQVYRGLPQAPIFQAAVAATAGEVLTWRGAPISAVYHSSSGGRTRNNEEVWAGSPPPYLRAVEDFDHLGKRYHWSQTYIFTWEELARALALPPEQGLWVTPLPSANGERVGFWFGGNGGGKGLKNEELRRLLGLPSANFRVFRYPELTEITQSTILPSGSSLLFTGNGSGHGVGLSQWGAAELATRGYTYRQILRHYYGPEIQLENYTAAGR